MKKDEKIKNIIEYRSAINSLVHERYHTLAQNYNLSLEQFHLLIELDELVLTVNDETLAPTIGDIAKSISNSQNTVSEKITRLENKGLVTRVKDSKDRRISRVILTEEGRKLIDEISSQATSKFLFDSISCLEEETIDKLLFGLEKLYEKMRSEKDG